MPKKKLTQKQAAFVEEYLVDFNATQAAIRAGYNEKGAHVRGAECVKNRKVQGALKKAIRRRSKRTEIKQDRVLKEYARLAFSDVRDVVEWGEDEVRFIPSDKLTKAQAAIVSGVKAKRTIYTNKEGDSEEKIELELKTYDKKGALDSVARHLGMFTDRHVHEHTGEVTLSQYLTAKKRAKNE